MGRDRRRPVVNPDLRTQCSGHLWIASASVLPSSGSANPTLTLMLLARCLSDHLGQQRASLGVRVVRWHPEQRGDVGELGRDPRHAASREATADATSAITVTATPLRSSRPGVSFARPRPRAPPTRLAGTPRSGAPRAQTGPRHPRLHQRSPAANSAGQNGRTGRASQRQPSAYSRSGHATRESGSARVLWRARAQMGRSTAVSDYTVLSALRLQRRISEYEAVHVEQLRYFMIP
jgi:hypothetical protein